MKFRFFKGFIERVNLEDQNYIPLPLNYDEPLMENRFIVKFPEHFNISERFIKRTTRPSYALNDDGSTIWCDTVIVLFDFNNNISQSIMSNIIENDELKQPFQYKLQMLNPLGDVVSEWLIDAQIYLIDFGELSYASNEMCEIKFHIHINQAHLNF